MRVLRVCALLFLATAVTVMADWDPEDGHKMHFPQLPNLQGLAVDATEPNVIGEDWQCSQTGPIKDFHFWGAWKSDLIGVIESFTIQVYTDIPANPTGGGPLYSRPGELLWRQEIREFVVRPWNGGPEGWYDPVTGQTIQPDHDNLFQYNIFLSQEQWFFQTEGTIYWLVITANVLDPANTRWGWKGSIEQFNDFPVICDPGLACVVPGQLSLPFVFPAPCPYWLESPLSIIDGLPPGSQITLSGRIDNLICNTPGGFCSFPQAGQCEEPGGSLGGRIACFSGDLIVEATGTGALAGYSRLLTIPVNIEAHLALRDPGAPVQIFDTEIMRLQGQIIGDPDFDLLHITAGTDFGLPSPGSTEVTQDATGSWHVDSFFDITYRIDFVGAPGSALGGMSGSTVGSTRVRQGGKNWLELVPNTPLPPRVNSFQAVVDPSGLVTGGGTDPFGQGWYFYPQEAWWNIWFYDHPFSYRRYKQILLSYQVDELVVGAPMQYEIAINWSTDLWSLEQPPFDSAPPLPGVPEDIYIGRLVVASGFVPTQGIIEIPIELPFYNPEWVSIDIRGFNYQLNGVIRHECIPWPELPPPFDLTLVVTATDADTCVGQLPGDVNNDGTIDNLDVNYLISFLYGGGPPPPIPANGDPNGDCRINIGDIIYLQDWLLGQGPAPVQCTCVNPDPTACCFNLRGNVDYDAGDFVDIADIVYFVEYSFGTPSGPAPPCLLEADVDGLGGLDVADIIYLVEYQFGTPSGPSPISCY